MNKREFVSEISKLRPGSTFLVLHKYTNAEGEVADFNIVFNVSYLNALKKSLVIVEAMKPVGELQIRAQAEVLVSLKTSIKNAETIPVDELEDGYHRYKDDDGKIIQGLKLHIESDTLHLFGFLNMKRVITAVEYRKVNSRELTIAKKEIMAKCPVSKFRQFRLRPDQVEKISVQSLSFLPPGESGV